MKKILMVLGLVGILGTTAFATDFQNKDAKKIVEVYNSNEAKFNKYYKGKTISGEIKISNIKKSFGDWSIQDENDTYLLDLSGDISEDKIADLDVGAVIKFEGTINRKLPMFDILMVDSEDFEIVQ